VKATNISTAEKQQSAMHILSSSYLTMFLLLI
jgi:hypothetical protein